MSAGSSSPLPAAAGEVPPALPSGGAPAGLNPAFAPVEPLSLREQLEAQYRRPQPRPNEVTPALAKYLDHLEARIEYLERRDREAHLPEECRKHECGYDTYRSYNPGNERDLDHLAFHAAERDYDQHAKTCDRYERGLRCPVCERFEKRLRA